MTNSSQCVVCPHKAAEHVMAENAQGWQGDYCTLCRTRCNARKPR